MIENTTNDSRISHKWRPIELIDDDEEKYDFSEIDSLQERWLEFKKEVESSTPEAYKAFTDRLTRRWAIETGIIEGIYDLDRGVTETLVNEGIAIDNIERSSTNKDPSELVEILRDHQDSVASVNKWIEEGYPLTKWFIKSLHSQILKNQRTTRAIDQFGTRFDTGLVKGEFKTQTNNPSRTDGTVHEYCPPEQVESELDNLIDFYEEYDAENCHPLLLAAWLHHRFEQIHPFQDGNGRVGRAILTWHLVKSGFFPIIISRDDRTNYICALETADQGNLTPLIDIFARLETNTILQAISDRDAEIVDTPEMHEPVDLVDQVIDVFVKRVERRRKSEAEQMRSVNAVAETLRDEANRYLDEKVQEVETKFRTADISIHRVLFTGGPGNNEHWYQRQVIETANSFAHWVNLFEPRYYIKLSLKSQSNTYVPRLSFVISLHNIGRQLSGVMAATAFAEIEYEEGTTVTNQQGGSFADPTFKNCTVNPFTFTSMDSAEKIRDRFIRWTEVCFSVALRYWMENS